MTDVLTNAVWHSLQGPHAAHAVVHGAALGYRPDVSVFHAVDELTSDAWDDLVALAPQGVVLFRALPRPEPPQGWEVRFGGTGHQMVQTRRPESVPALPADAHMRPLGDADVDAMVDLVARTEPGPFRRGTIDLGGYIGIFHGPQLVAMAGTRLRPPGFVEVSAVCTDPSARRRGYASIVSAAVADAIRDEGEVPMLHVADDNDSARTVYEQLGFETVRMCAFTLYGPTRSPS